jgi:hypothetical protein
VTECTRIQPDGKLLARFMSKVAKVESGCWEWQAFRERDGYGRFRLGKHQLAHRVSYLMFVGSIPDGLVIDHICRVRCCVNPVHLRAVTNRENILAEGSLAFSKANSAAVQCPRGHDLVEPNLIPGSLRRGFRACLACNRAAGTLRWARVRGEDLDLAQEADRHHARIFGLAC